MRTPPRNPVVPAAVKPAVGGRKRSLCGYEVILTGSPKYTLSADPITGIVGPLSLGDIEVEPSVREMRMTAQTYNLVTNDHQAMGHLLHEATEAVRLMKTTMIDVSSYSKKPTVPRTRPKPQAAQSPTTVLMHQLQLLVTDMARLDTTNPTAVSDAVARYAKLRDQIAQVRADFAEAESRFEIIQEQLLQKLGGDE